MKMNVLLYAPPLLLLMLKVRTFLQYLQLGYVAFFDLLRDGAHVPCFFSSHMQAMDISGVLLALSGAALVQVTYFSVSFVYL